MEILLILPGFILAIITMVMYKIKLRKSQNKVHFYVARDKNEGLTLWLGKPCRGKLYWSFDSSNNIVMAVNNELSLYGLDIKDYDNLKWEDEPVEVFLNLED